MYGTTPHYRKYDLKKYCKNNFQHFLFPPYYNRQLRSPVKTAQNTKPTSPAKNHEAKAFSSSPKPHVRIYAPGLSGKLPPYMYKTVRSRASLIYYVTKIIRSRRLLRLSRSPVLWQDAACTNARVAPADLGFSAFAQRATERQRSALLQRLARGQLCVPGSW